MNNPPPVSVIARQTQTGILVLLSFAILVGAPEVWNYTPDSGIYIGSAVSLVQDGRYWFNGHPNLLYYPGTSTLLTIPIALFGMNFHAMHILFGLLAVATLWLARAYFSAERFGWTGLLLPVLLGVNQLFQAHAQLVLSDIAFLNLVMLALCLWRRFESTGDQRWFFACAAVVAVSPMFRFQGLFLIGAFGLAVLTDCLRLRDTGWGRAFRFLGIAALTLLPFLLWTLRNYVLHTPDTHNMANQAFFGLSGLQLSGQGFGTVEWIDADWKYPLYQTLYLFGGLGKGFLGQLHEHVPLELVTAFVLGLIVAGGRAWLRQAGVFEAAFIMSATVMLVQQFVGGNSLYIVIRYWLPILPFFIVIAGFGIQRIRELTALPGIQKIITAGAGSLTLTLLIAGALSWSDRLSAGNTENMAQKFDLTRNVADYVRDHVPPTATILASDWGVAPLMTGRRSYKYIRSPCHKDTLELILEKNPSHLVITPNFIESPMALSMAETYPQVFEPIFSAGDRQQGTYGAVFAIDKKQIPAVIDDLRCPREDPV